MIGAKVTTESSVPFPKLMANENVVALMWKKDAGVVVHQLRGIAVDVGTKVERLTPADFRDYSGSIRLSND